MDFHQVETLEHARQCHRDRRCVRYGNGLMMAVVRTYYVDTSSRRRAAAIDIVSPSVVTFCQNATSARRMRVQIAYKRWTLPPSLRHVDQILVIAHVLYLDTSSSTFTLPHHLSIPLPHITSLRAGEDEKLHHIEQTAPNVTIFLKPIAPPAARKPDDLLPLRHALWRIGTVHCRSVRLPGSGHARDRDAHHVG